MNTRSKILAAVAVAMLAFSPVAKVTAQGTQNSNYTLPPFTVAPGFLGTAGGPPVGTGCTIAAGSTDGDGSCTATATSGAIVFKYTGLTNAPFCLLVDQSATPAAVYTVTNLQITLTTITSSHVYRWHCVAPPGW